MNLLEQLNYFHQLWRRLFPTRELPDERIINWLEFGQPEVEKVWSKAARRFRTEPITTENLYRYISATLTHRRNDAEKSVGAARLQQQEVIKPEVQEVKQGEL